MDYYWYGSDGSGDEEEDVDGLDEELEQELAALRDLDDADLDTDSSSDEAHEDAKSVQPGDDDGDDDDDVQSAAVESSWRKYLAKLAAEDSFVEELAPVEQEMQQLVAEPIVAFVHADRLPPSTNTQQQQEEQSTPATPTASSASSSGDNSQVKNTVEQARPVELPSKYRDPAARAVTDASAAMARVLALEAERAKVEEAKRKLEHRQAEDRLRQEREFQAEQRRIRQRQRQEEARIQATQARRAAQLAAAEERQHKKLEELRAQAAARTRAQQKEYQLRRLRRERERMAAADQRSLQWHIAQQQLAAEQRLQREHVHMAAEDARAVAVARWRAQRRAQRAQVETRRMQGEDVRAQKRARLKAEANRIRCARERLHMRLEERRMRRRRINRLKRERASMQREHHRATQRADWLRQQELRRAKEEAERRAHRQQWATACMAEEDRRSALFSAALHRARMAALRKEEVLRNAEQCRRDGHDSLMVDVSAAAEARNIRRHRAATCVQCSWRQHMARLELQELRRQHNARIRASVVFQKHARRRIAQRLHGPELRKRWQQLHARRHGAATRIQALWRGSLLRLRKARLLRRVHSELAGDELFADDLDEEFPVVDESFYIMKDVERTLQRDVFATLDWTKLPPPPAEREDVAVDAQPDVVREQSTAQGASTTDPPPHEPVEATDDVPAKEPADVPIPQASVPAADPDDAGLGGQAKTNGDTKADSVVKVPSRKAKARALAEEWGFSDPRTAAAMMSRAKRMTRASRRKNKKKLDPMQRWKRKEAKLSRAATDGNLSRQRGSVRVPRKPVRVGHGRLDLAARAGKIRPSATEPVSLAAGVRTTKDNAFPDVHKAKAAWGQQASPAHGMRPRSRSGRRSRGASPQLSGRRVSRPSTPSSSKNHPPNSNAHITMNNGSASSQLRRLARAAPAASAQPDVLSHTMPHPPRQPVRAHVSKAFPSSGRTGGFSLPTYDYSAMPSDDAAGAATSGAARFSRPPSTAGSTTSLIELSDDSMDVDLGTRGGTPHTVVPKLAFGALGGGPPRSTPENSAGRLPDVSKGSGRSSFAAGLGFDYNL